MSWAQISKQLEIERDNSFNNIYVFESSTTFTAPKKGYYKIICVGAGGTAYASGVTSSDYMYHNCMSGAAGGVAIKNKSMLANDTLTIAISSSGVATCDGMTANFGGNAYDFSSAADTAPVGGTATGGVWNYKGSNGAKRYRGSNPTVINGGSIGCILPGLMTRDDAIANTARAYSGWGLYGHGGGAGACSMNTGNMSSDFVNITGVSDKQPAAVIIIPLPSL